MSTFYDELISDVNEEIEHLHGTKKRYKAYINYHDLVKDFGNTYIYDIWLSDELHLEEEEDIQLSSVGHHMTATVVTVHENQNITIRLNGKLTKEIYTLTKTFDPTFILTSLKVSLNQVKSDPNELSCAIQSACTFCETFELNECIELPSSLNHSQKLALAKAENYKISFIWGPPGTGKTFTLAQIIFRAYLRGDRALIVSTSNVAVDQVLLAFDRLSSNLDKSSVWRLGTSDEQRCIEYTREGLDTNKAKLVFSTLATLVIKYPIISTIPFDMVIIDEASMVSLPYIFITANLSKRNTVIVGDFNQLPPISQTSS